MAKVLVVDDEKGVRITLAEFLREEGHEVETVANVADAINLLNGRYFDVILTDIVLPQTSGLELMKFVKEKSPGTQVILITGEPTVATAVQAVRAGAFDYLSKPITGKAICSIVAHAVQVKALNEENKILLKEIQAHRDHLEELVEVRTHALAESEEKYRNLVEMLSDGVCIIQNQQVKSLLSG